MSRSSGKAFFLSKEELEIICIGLRSISWEGVNEKREETRKELEADLQSEADHYA